MGLNTWMSEFFEPLHSLEGKKPSEVTKMSLDKWIGLSPANLRRHEVEILDGLLTDGISSLPIVSRGYCSLCVKYMERPEDGCDLCPLYQNLHEACNGSPKNPYRLFVTTEDPTPMIQALADTYLKLRMNGM